MRMQVILDSLFARPGSAPIRGGKKGEFRPWTIWEQAGSSKKERDTRFSAIQDAVSREDIKAWLQKEAMEESSEDGSKTKSKTTYQKYSNYKKYVNFHIYSYH